MYDDGMKWQAMIKTMMEESEKYGGVMTRWELKNRLGWTSPTGVYKMMESKKITLQKFFMICEIMEYDILVIPRNPRRTAFKVTEDT